MFQNCENHAIVYKYSKASLKYFKQMVVYLSELWKSRLCGQVLTSTEKYFEQMVAYDAELWKSRHCIVKYWQLLTSMEKYWQVFRTNGGICFRIAKITPLHIQVLTLIDKYGKVLTSISSKWWHMFQLCGNHAARIEELIPPERLNMSDPRYNQQPAFCTRNILGVINYNLNHES